MKKTVSAIGIVLIIAQIVMFPLSALATENSYSTMAFGPSHTLAIKTDGSLWAWGSNEYGQLGDGTGIDWDEPIKVMDGVADVNLGTDFSLALKTDGSLWAWGRNDRGQLGDGTTTDRHSPVRIMGDVATFWGNNAVKKTDGSVWSWGDHVYGYYEDDGTPILCLSPVRVTEYISVLFDGLLLEFDTWPRFMSQRVMVPMRAVFEALGATVDWNQATQTVTAKKGDTVINLTIGDTSATVNGQVITIDQPAVLLGGGIFRIMVPIRFIAESLGAEVVWDPTTQTVIITS